MVGSGPELFAVWGYVIANTVDSQVELNPRHVAGLLGMSPEAVQQCIERLCTPDPESRSKVADGRRLIREGEFAYFVPNHAAYRAVRDERDRREYNRLKKAEGRARGVNVRVKKSKRVNARVKRSTRESTVSAQAEAEAETTAASAAAVVPAAAQRSAAATWDILRGNLDTQHLEAIERLVRASQRPDAVLACIRAAGPGGMDEQVGVGWADVGKACFELAATSGEFAPVRLRAFIRKLHEAPPLDPTERPGDAARRRAAELERAAKGGES